jgi:hypothetical protein
VGGAATARLPALSAGTPGGSLDGELEPPPLIVIAPVGEFLEPAAAFRRPGTVRHRQGRGPRGEDSRVFENDHGGQHAGPFAMVTAGYRFERVIGIRKKGAAEAAPPFPSGTSMFRSFGASPFDPVAVMVTCTQA